MHCFPFFTKTIKGDCMKEDGLSLAEIWSIVMRKKILVGIVWVIVSLLCLLSIIFLFNRLNVTYRQSFNYRWYGIENNSFADGDVFNYYDIVSKNSIDFVKNSKERYQHINTEELAENIDIQKEDNLYVLTVKGKVFSNDREAKDFINDLIYLPYLKAISLTFDFNSNLESYRSVHKIDAKLRYLERQINLLVNGYKGMISYFGNVELEQKSLNSLLNEIEVFSSNRPISEYRYLAYKNTYMSKEEYSASIAEFSALETEKTLLEKRKTSVIDSIRKIYEASTGASYIDTALSEYVSTLHSIDLRLLEITESLEHINKASLGQYNEEASQKFLDELNLVYEKVKGFTETYTKSVSQVLQKTTFININSFEVSGKINNLISVMLSVFIGLCVGLASGFIAGVQKKKKFSEI